MLVLQRESLVSSQDCWGWSCRAGRGMQDAGSGAWRCGLCAWEGLVMEKELPWLVVPLELPSHSSGVGSTASPGSALPASVGTGPRGLMVWGWSWGFNKWKLSITFHTGMLNPVRYTVFHLQASQFICWDRCPQKSRKSAFSSWLWSTWTHFEAFL